MTGLPNTQENTVAPLVAGRSAGLEPFDVVVFARLLCIAREDETGLVALFAPEEFLRQLGYEPSPATVRQLRGSIARLMCARLPAGKRNSGIETQLISRVANEAEASVTHDVWFVAMDDWAMTAAADPHRLVALNEDL
jgi:hypothetical protein